MNPVWVKIADFGVSKCTKSTILRTRVGTEGYAAPELLGLLGMANTVYSNWIDIWALGCIVHEMLTGEIPFLDCTAQHFDSEFSLETRPIDELTPQTDTGAMHAFCRGEIPFPTDSMRRSGVSTAAEQCVRSMLVAIPESRVTAQDALQNEWLQPPVVVGEEGEADGEQQVRRNNMSVSFCLTSKSSIAC